jgi:hypothetical protein
MAEERVLLSAEGAQARIGIIDAVDHR